MDSINFSYLGFLALCLGAYGLGSINGAMLVCRIFSLPDPNKYGSGNPGATNIYRLGGIWPAVITLSVDTVKGLLPATAALLLGYSAIPQGLIAIAAIAGHMLPLFYERGGKGVATTWGAGMVIAPTTTTILCIVWLSMILITRLSSVASLSAVCLAPIVAKWFDPEFKTIFWIISITILIRHHKNIIQLIQRRELPVHYAKKTAQNTKKKHKNQP